MAHVKLSNVRYQRPTVGLVASLILGLVAAACGAMTLNSLTMAQMLKELGLEATGPTMASTIASESGAVGPAGNGCSNWSQAVFIPPSASGETLNGSGIPFTYDEVISSVIRCQTAARASDTFSQRAAQARSVESLQPVSGVGTSAVIFNGTNTEEYPSVFYIVSWQKGQYIGSVEVAGPRSDRHITESFAESFASRVASSTVSS